MFSRLLKPGRRRRGTLVSAALLLSVAGWWLVPLTVQLPPRLLEPLPVSATYLAADGSPLRQMLTENGQRVAPSARFSELPPMLVHATLAAEDKRFFSHGGVDLQAIARAAWDDLRAGRVVSGASTLTQQLAKISAATPPKRTLWVKFTEALQARHIEMMWSKERILTEYLNRVTYGNLLTGSATAASGYFNKPLADLSPAECALLASIPQAPGRLNPFHNLHDLRKRQLQTLQQMRDAGWLSAESHELAKREKPVFHRFTGGFAAPHAVGLAARSVGADAGIVRTTIEPDLQARVEGIINRQLELLRNRHVTQAAAVVLDNKTGHVLALAGSRDFTSPEGGQINGAWSPHSPGSAMKPFTYLLALQRGFTAASVIPDLPIEYNTPTGVYRPENYDHRNYGPVTVRNALGSSLNIPAVRVLQQIGGETVLLDALQKLGLTSLDQPPEHYGLGLTIGNAPVRLLELANAYACLARLGEYRPWSLLTAADPAQPVRLFPAQESYIIADILSDNQARVLTFGPHSVIRLPFHCAVKTGTSTSYRDNWTLGFTPEFTVGVWAGNFDNTPMERVSGVTGAGPIFRDIFTALHQRTATTWYAEPAGIDRAVIDPRLGQRIPASGPPPRVSQEEIFLHGTMPATATPEDYEPATQRAYLPHEYASWLQRGDNWLTGLAAIRPIADARTPLRITTPVSGSIFYLDPDLKEGGRRLQLRAMSAGKVSWSSSTLKIESQPGATYAMLEPGSHEVTALVLETGESVSSRLEVMSPEEASVRRLTTGQRRPAP